MANPIKASDLYQDDGALERAIKQLHELQAAVDALRKESATLTVQVKKQNAATSEGREDIARTAKAAEQLARENEKLTAAYSSTNKEVQRLRAERAKANQIAKAEARLAESAAGSYDALSAQYTLNKIKLNAMGEEQRKATKAGQQLEKQTKAIYEEMKELQAATGKTALNVGNYAEGVKAAIKETFGLEKAFNLLSKTPLLGIIGLIVGAVGALFQAFTRSQRGADLMAKATGALQGVMTLLTKAADKVADVLISLWEDPVQGVKDLWAAIKDNIVNRFEGLIGLFQAVGNGLQALWERDLPGLKKAATEAAQAVVQLSTGMDADAQRDFAGAINETVVALANLAGQRREIIRQNRELQKQAEQLATAEQLAQVYADDATRSFAEREEAAERARQRLEERAAVEVRIAKNNLSLVEREIALRRAAGEDVENLLDQQLSAFQALAAAQRDYTVTVADNEKTRRELVQDRLERDLDILIDGFDNIKTINERIIADETQTFERRRAILAETARLAGESFQKQIATIQQFTGVQVNANELIAESDAVALNARIRALGLSEIIEGRLLEIIRERRLAVSDLAQAQKELAASTKASFEAIEALTGPQGRAAQVQKKRAEDAKLIMESLSKNARDFGSSISDGAAVTQEGMSQLKSAFGQAKQAVGEYMQQQAQLADLQLQQAQAGVQAAQNELQTQLQLDAQGYASRVETAQAELEIAKQKEEEAARLRQRAQRQQLIAQSVEQASNLITAVSKLFATLPFFLALPASATLFGTFAAAKIKAFQATKLFREGGYELLDGGSHASGNDVPLYTGRDGRQRRAEGGEGMAIFSRQAVGRYGDILPDLVHAINRGELERKYAALAHATDGLNISAPIVHVNQGGVEKRLDAIRADGRRKVYQDGRGRTVEVIGNRKITYV